MAGTSVKPLRPPHGLGWFNNPIEINSDPAEPAHHADTAIQPRQPTASDDRTLVDLTGDAAEPCQKGKARAKSDKPVESRNHADPMETRPRGRPKTRNQAPLVPLDRSPDFKTPGHTAGRANLSSTTGVFTPEAETNPVTGDVDAAVLFVCPVCVAYAGTNKAHLLYVTRNTRKFNAHMTEKHGLDDRAFFRLFRANNLINLGFPLTNNELATMHKVSSTSSATDQENAVLDLVGDVCLTIPQEDHQGTVHQQDPNAATRLRILRAIFYDHGFHQRHSHSKSSPKSVPILSRIGRLGSRRFPSY